MVPGPRGRAEEPRGCPRGSGTGLSLAPGPPDTPLRIRKRNRTAFRRPSFPALESSADGQTVSVSTEAERSGGGWKGRSLVTPNPGRSPKSPASQALGDSREDTQSLGPCAAGTSLVGRLWAWSGRGRLIGFQSLTQPGRHRPPRGLRLTVRGAGPAPTGAAGPSRGPGSGLLSPLVLWARGSSLICPD